MGLGGTDPARARRLRQRRRCTPYLSACLSADPNPLRTVRAGGISRAGNPTG